MANRQKQVHDPEGHVTSFQYDLAGRQTAGVTTTHVYDDAGRTLVVGHTDSIGSAIEAFTYTYDNVGNRLTQTEADGAVTTWTYDDAYQLTRERRSGTTSFAITHVYDAAGNRERKIEQGAVTSYTYDDANGGEKVPGTFFRLIPVAAFESDEAALVVPQAPSESNGPSPSRRRVESSSRRRCARFHPQRQSSSRMSPVH